jgi:HlyD family secretion protein
MKNTENDIIYSEPVNEIMGQVPGKILRRGNSIIFIVFLVSLLLAWLIKYPDRIPAPVEITTANPPVTLVSKLTGRIQNLYVKDKENIVSGQLIAVMETAASIDDINRLRQTIDTMKNPGWILPSELPGFTSLGEIQGYWSSFLSNLSDYHNYVVNDFYGYKINSINDEIDGILAYIAKIRIKEKLYIENRNLEARKFSRDSLLRINGVYSESELEKSKQSLLKINIELQQVRLDHSDKSIELAEKRQLLQDYKIKRLEDKEKYYSALNESFLNLKAQIAIWENTYLLVSPVDGVITFTRFWSKNQIVSKDEAVLSIIPADAGDFMGRISLKMNRSGKVKTGQTVNIKFSSYPFLEYGMVKGVIKSKSLVPSGDFYVLEIDLPDGLTTLYGKKLEFTQNMQGTAEIITDDLRLLQKIINPFRYLISRNRT